MKAFIKVIKRMKKISNNVSISFENYRVSDKMLLMIAEKLSHFLKFFIKEIHKSGFRVDNANPLPEYTKGYLRLKASILGVSRSSITPDLILKGELHDSAHVGVSTNAIGYDSEFKLTLEGFLHLHTLNSVNTWETLSVIDTKYWDNDILPYIEGIMDTFKGKMLDRGSSNFSLF